MILTIQHAPDDSPLEEKQLCVIHKYEDAILCLRGMPLVVYLRYQPNPNLRRLEEAYSPEALEDHLRHGRQDDYAARKYRLFSADDLTKEQLLNWWL